MLPRRVVAIAVAVLVALVSVVVSVVADRSLAPDPRQPRLSTPLVIDWVPAGSAPAIVISNPGAGGARTVRVGDRIRLVRQPGPGGLQLEQWAGHLVPYGGEEVYLAVAAGTLRVENTVYDRDRPCVPPQPVSEFSLVIKPGPRPSIPPVKRVLPSDAGRVIELAPGQQVATAPGLGLSGRGRGDVLSEMTWGIYAVRPGRAEVDIEQPRESGKPRVSTTVSIRVVAPTDIAPPGGQPPQTDVAARPALAARLSGSAPGLLAAAPVRAPLCG